MSGVWAVNSNRRVGYCEQLTMYSNMNRRITREIGAEKLCMT